MLRRIDLPAGDGYTCPGRLLVSPCPPTIKGVKLTVTIHTSANTLGIEDKETTH